MSSSDGRCGCDRLGRSAVCLLGVLLGVGSLALACPSSCKCISGKITCTEPGIVAFPVLSSAAEMENITEIYIANQPNLSGINERDMEPYTGLRNLTLVNCGLTFISRQGFLYNPRLQYINLSNNRFSSLSWKPFRHLELTHLILTKNPLLCSCDIVWIQLMQEKNLATLESQNLTCRGENDWKMLLSHMRIPDCELPKAAVNASNITLNEGGELVVGCTSNGLPAPTIFWKEHNLMSAYQTTEPSKPPVILKLTQVSGEDNAQQLICIAENIVGESKAFVNLTVLFPPRITLLGQAISDHHWCIPFSVMGNPPPTIQWYHNNHLLNETDFILTQIHEENFSELHGCLQLDNPTHLNNGNYTLYINNDLGQDERTISAHFMLHPLGNEPVDPDFYVDYYSAEPSSGTSEMPSDNPPVTEKKEDSIAVYVVVGTTALVFTGLILVLIIFKFGKHAKFGMKGRQRHIVEC
uniref:BDNF/NT-3 growth factors receptor n=1 Tax=Callorhinchus milii TaxID=7868 RepID=V9KMQ8_CALMI